MDFKTYFLRQVMMSFFVVVTCVTLVMAVVGTVFEPDARFGYGILFSPLIYGGIAALIQVVMYSKKELSVRQAVAREFLHLALVEAAVMGMLYGVHALTRPALTISLAFAILIIYVTVTLVMWLNDQRTSSRINEGLKELQKRNPEISER